MEEFKSLKIAVVGAGALGGYYGGLMARAGFDVRFFVRTGKEEIEKKGWRVDSIHGDFVVPNVKVYNQFGDSEPCDLLLISTKSTANESLAQMIKPLVKKESVLVNLQNGLGFEEMLQTAYPENLVIGGLCFLCANKEGPGHVKHLDYGAIKLANHNPALWEKLGKNSLFLEAILSESKIENSWSSSLPEARWQKLVWNIPYNGLCTLYNRDTAALIREPGLELWAFELMKEVQGAASACGVEIKDNFLERMILNTRKMVNYKPSMLLDFEWQRPLELEYMYWKPIQMAMQNGFDMKLTRSLVRQLSIIDPGGYQPESPLLLD